MKIVEENKLFCVDTCYFDKNPESLIKQAYFAVCTQTLPTATPQIGKTHLFSKIAMTLE